MEETKPRAIIFDVDGTLAHGWNRLKRRGQKAGWFADWDAHDDEPDEHVIHMLNALKSDFKIVICSGRKDSSREVLETWLKENDVYYDDIFMRKHNDNRQDAIIKREIYDNNIEPNYDIWLVFDDRDQVVNMWRNDLGFKVFQVQEGAF